MYLWASYEKKNAKKNKIFFASLKSMKKGVGPGVGSGPGSRTGFGSISQRYGSGDTDPDPHQNVTGSLTLLSHIL
jgi:hypothetical protein